jgi:hypothetical protein
VAVRCDGAPRRRQLLLGHRGHESGEGEVSSRRKAECGQSSLFEGWEDGGGNLGFDVVVLLRWSYSVEEGSCSTWGQRGVRDRPPSGGETSWMELTMVGNEQRWRL